jgi:hypothetical protein
MDAPQENSNWGGLRGASSEDPSPAGAFAVDNLKRVADKGAMRIFHFDGRESARDLLVWIILAAAFIVGTFVVTTLLIAFSRASGLIPLRWFAVALLWTVLLAAGIATLSFFVRFVRSRGTAEGASAVPPPTSAEPSLFVIAPQSWARGIKTLSRWWRNRKSRGFLIAGAAGALVLLVLLSVASADGNSSRSDRGGAPSDCLSMPSLYGLDSGTARRVSSTNGLDLVAWGSPFVGQPDIIQKQSPEAGTLVCPGDPVTYGY